MTHSFRALLMALLCAVPGLALALGLGEIHLDSSLNQPLAAQIELLDATPDDLAQLKATLASRDTFQRYGVDRPQFLSSVTFQVGQGANGLPVLLVRSTETATEPFLTFLVDVTWPRGKLTREYTLLLDPPVFDSSANAAAPAEVQAPTTGATTGQKPAPIARPAAPAATAAATPEPAPGATSTYTVVAGDTLSGIARRLRGANGADLDQLMIGIFRANPSAFEGNINRLHRGATLSIPPAADLASLSPAEAHREVHAQIESWRSAGGGSAAAKAPGPQLKLVTPKTPPVPAPTPAPPPAAPVGAPAAASAKGDKRVELPNQALSDLQKQAAQPPAPTAPAPGEPKSAESKPAEPKSAESAPPVAAPAAPAAAPKLPRKPKVVAPPPPAPGLLDTLSGLWLPIGGAVVLLLAGGAAWFLMRRRKAMVAADVEHFDSASAQPLFDEEPPLADELHAEARQAGVPLDDAHPAAGEAHADTGMSIDSADPLAEADFHLAYGLYDQAADIVKQAMSREPERRDLRLKLLEVYFVWSNKTAFLDLARDFARERATAPPGEWDKVAIMGRQIAPEEALFADASGRDAAAAGVDLDLAPDGHTEAPGIDLEFLGDEDPAAAHEDVDLDLHQAFSGHDPLAETGAPLATHGDVLDLDLTHDPLLGSRPAPGGAVDPTVERPVLALDGHGAIDIGHEDIGHAERAHEAVHARAANGEPDLSLEGLDYDIDKLNATSYGVQSLDRTMVRTPFSEPTRIAPRPAAFAGETGAHDTRIAPRVPLDHGATDTVAASGPGHEAEIDFDLEQLAASLDEKVSPHTAAHPAHDDLDFELSEHDLLTATGSHGTTPSTTAKIDAGQLAMHSLEPATLSEVGTKIDLARAYMDMGDPDGARSILNEVLNEGSASQRQEAQRLIAGLPG